MKVAAPEPVPPRPAWRQRLRAYALLMRLDRPIGILLLLWPTLWALWIAGSGHPPWPIAVIFVLGVVLMRSAGCAVNDYADRNFDGAVARTRQRPLPVGSIRPGEALAVFVALSVLAFLLVLLLNRETILMSFVAVSLAAVYPFMKRYTHFPQLILGIAFGWAVPMAFTAVSGEVSLVGWVLFVAAISWTLAYDTEYAMVDREDDLKVGIKSTAILFGRYDRLAIGLFQALSLAALAYAGALAGRGPIYSTGLVLAALLAIHQQWRIRNREPSACFRAFLDNNALGMLVFIALALDYLKFPAVSGGG